MRQQEESTLSGKKVTTRKIFSVDYQEIKEGIKCFRDEVVKVVNDKSGGSVERSSFLESEDECYYKPNQKFIKLNNDKKQEVQSQPAENVHSTTKANKKYQMKLSKKVAFNNIKQDEEISQNEFKYVYDHYSQYFKKMTAGDIEHVFNVYNLFHLFVDETPSGVEIAGEDSSMHDQ
ncbi:hypothetical protein [Candidatus Trichorickettsia mobilis]|uniref:hypothetical protein n=1 Tax=Candidatus Trichorickettsia mobilis TaxID=1346319 RepID=UPI002930D665|nr:hypothetical protein [Candidatus Trichorickettsia mobilis]